MNLCFLTNALPEPDFKYFSKLNVSSIIRALEQVYVLHNFLSGLRLAEAKPNLAFVPLSGTSAKRRRRVEDSNL